MRRSGQKNYERLLLGNRLASKTFFIHNRMFVANATTTLLEEVLFSDKTVKSNDSHMVTKNKLNKKSIFILRIT